MPTHFIVEVPEGTPRLFVSQQPLNEIEKALRGFPYSHTKRKFIYIPRLLPAVPGAVPQGCGQLSLVSLVDYEDKMATHLNLFSAALDKLPYEQALEECVKAQKFIEELRAERAIEEERKNLVLPTNGAGEGTESQ